MQPQEQGPDLNRFFQQPQAKAGDDFNRWLEQSDDLLNLLEHDLRGDKLSENKDGLFWEKGKGQPLMNEEGIRFVIGFLRHLTNKNTYMSDVSEERVNEICLSTGLSLTDALFFHWVEFDLSSDYFNVVVEKCSNVFEFAIRRAMDGGERKFLRQTESIHRVYSQQGQASGGFMPSIFGGRKPQQ